MRMPEYSKRLASNKRRTEATTRIAHMAAKELGTEPSKTEALKVLEKLK